MLLVVDVGNTQTHFGVFEDGRTELAEHWRFATVRDSTGDELGAALSNLLDLRGLSFADVDESIVSSTVPQLSEQWTQMAERYLGHHMLVVGPSIRTGMPIRYDNPAEVGADRIVNAVAARERFGVPVIVVDFGTATTFDVVNAAGESAGGIICPGILISAEALFAQASRLYQVDVRRPPELVGRNTATAMQAGIYYGYIGLVDGILERLLAEIPGVRTVVATGGQADLIAAGSKYIREVDPLLTLVGLKLIYEKNRT